MADKVDATLKQLTSISHTLNEASDLLSNRISELEAYLREYKLGVEAWINLIRETEANKADDGRIYELVCVRQLGYGKHNGKWGLLVAKWYEEFPDEVVEISFLRDTPRGTRLSAVEKLPDLLKALVQKATEVTEEATKKAEKVRRIAAGLNKKAR